MKRIIFFVTMLITLCCVYQCSGKVLKIENGLYSGQKRGVMSNAVFFS
jgi:hypothetical protein